MDTAAGPRFRHSAHRSKSARPSLPIGQGVSSSEISKQLSYKRLHSAFTLPVSIDNADNYT